MRLSECMIYICGEWLLLDLDTPFHTDYFFYLEVNSQSGE